jgi:hypothetical protein
MPKWIDEIKYDLKFLRSHTLQPQWFKIARECQEICVNGI